MASKNISTNILCHQCSQTRADQVQVLWPMSSLTKRASSWKQRQSLCITNVMASSLCTFTPTFCGYLLWMAICLCCFSVLAVILPLQSELESLLQSPPAQPHASLRQEASPISRRTGTNRLWSTPHTLGWPKENKTMQKNYFREINRTNRVLGKQNYSLGNVVRASYTLRKALSHRRVPWRK